MPCGLTAPSTDEEDEDEDEDEEDVLTTLTTLELSSLSSFLLAILNRFSSGDMVLLEVSFSTREGSVVEMATSGSGRGLFLLSNFRKLFLAAASPGLLPACKAAVEDFKDTGTDVVEDTEGAV
jgi:hypothetical protein